MRKRGKKVELGLSQKHTKKYKLTFGTVNNSVPNTIYVVTSSWITPKEDDDAVNYEGDIRLLKKEIKSALFQYISNKHSELLDPNRIMVDLDIRSSGVKYGKQSYMNCEITLFNINKLPIHDVKMNQTLKRISRFMTYNIFDKNNTFSFHSEKV